MLATEVGRDEQHRFESFKFGLTAPAQSTSAKHAHKRSHSRNASTSLSFSNSKPTTPYDMTFTVPNTLSTSSSANITAAPVTTTPHNSLPPNPKRSSHHKRRSSVSTRHESAEIMGVSMPDLPISLSSLSSMSSMSSSDENAEKDSIRRRALWALEGKPDAGVLSSYSKVEIPDVLDEEKQAQDGSFDFPTRPSFPPGAGLALNMNMMSSKRDSFRVSSAKDTLGTLVEEDEEEEDSPKKQLVSTPQSKPFEPLTPTTPVSPSFSRVSSLVPFNRPRPANLNLARNLRPLSLTPENLGVATSHGLPTPAPTPTPRGLKSLSLTPTFTPTPISSSSHDEPMHLKRLSLVPSVSPTPNTRRPVLNLNINTSSFPEVVVVDDDNDKPKPPVRKSSISYKSSYSSSTGSSSGSPAVNLSLAGLPTPEMTPTFTERRRGYSSGSLMNDLKRSSLSSSEDRDELVASPEEDFYASQPSMVVAHQRPGKTRPLSVSEQHFLFKSHNALLARITDLEKALTVRRRESGGFPSNAWDSRPVSIASDFSSTTSEPSDEMLRLVADLKAERDELKRDVDGWRMRVGDLEKQIGVFVKRVEGERRDAWVARSKVGVMEVEKGNLEARVGALEGEKSALEGEKERLRQENENLLREKMDVEEENARLREEVEKLKQKAEADDVNADADVLGTPTPASFAFNAVTTRRRGLGFASLDSDATDVDLESFNDDAHHFGFALKAVEEEFEGDEEAELSEEDNGLAGYEDEEEDDLNFQSPHLGSSSSFGSDSDFCPPRSVAHLTLDVPASPITPTTPTLTDSGSGTPTVRSRSSSPLETPGDEAPRSQTHQSRASLSKTWTFPRSQFVTAAPVPQLEVDKFFGCLQDSESNSDLGSPVSPEEYTYERSKSLFSQGLSYGGDDDTPFFLPNDVTGTIVADGSSASLLDVVVEEEEDEDVSEEETQVDDDDDDMFGDIGGIKITFTPPQEDDAEDDLCSQSPLQKAVPIFNDSDDEEEEAAAPFNFGRPLPVSKQVATPPSSTMITPPSSIPRPNSPSSIPRPSSSFRSSSMASETPTKPSRFPLPASHSAFVTPPAKRGGPKLSFIPQPVSSPSPIRSPPTKQIASIPPPTTTFIRQPQRKPLMSAASANTSSKVQNVNASMNTTLRRSPDDFAGTASSKASPMKSVDLSDPSRDNRDSEYPSSLGPGFNQVFSPSASTSISSSITSIMTSPITSRISLQSFSSYMPLSWSSPSPRAPSSLCIVPESSSSSASNASSDGDVVMLPRGYVSKEVQLEKLKTRLYRERAMIRNPPFDACKRCDGEAVYL